MSEQEYVCDKCGHVVRIGDFPYCGGDPRGHGPWRTADEPIEEFVDDVIAEEPVRFSSTREWVRYMDKHDIVPREDRGNRIRGGQRIFIDMAKR
jgi:hypothetical protein